MKTKTLLLAVVLVISFSASFANAGGPFAVASDNSGKAMKWQDGRLTWYIDPGNISPNGSHIVGASWLDDVFENLVDIKLGDATGRPVVTSNFTHLKKGPLDKDVTVENYEEFINKDAAKTSIIFDADGKIIDDYFGVGSSEHIVGLSGPLNAYGEYITAGFALFNGAALEQKIFTDKIEIFEPLFKAMMIHELGHLINLDHTQVNVDEAEACRDEGTIVEREGSCGETGHVIPTMYPELFTFTQESLNVDDKIGISSIYPTTAFTNNFCTITGKIYDARGRFLRGVNVVASKATGTDIQNMVDSRSFVSGAMTLGCVGDSSYYLRGIVPGVKYKVIAEPLNERYTGESGFEPFASAGLTSPHDFERQTLTDQAGNTTVSCANGGETIEMASLAIEVRNPCTNAGTDGDSVAQTAGENSADGSSSGGGCALVVGGSPASSVQLIWALAAMMVVRVFTKKRV